MESDNYVSVFEWLLDLSDWTLKGFDVVRAPTKQSNLQNSINRHSLEDTDRK